MDQTTLGLSEIVLCAEMGSVIVHYSRREEPHCDYPFPVLCKIERDRPCVAWALSEVNGIFHLRVRSGGPRYRVARLEWIAPIELVELM